MDIDSLAHHARVMWRDASARVSNAQLELFVKVAIRSKAARAPAGVDVRLHETIESGFAVRAIRDGEQSAGFAASSGLDPDAVRWAAHAACTFEARASASAPRGSEVEQERWDLDAASSLPSDEELTSALVDRSTLGWIETGTTMELLVGCDGWIAARRRHRVWAMREGPAGGLLAQRGFDRHQALLDRNEDRLHGAGAGVTGRSNLLLLTPRAAAPVVTALVNAFHREGSPKRERGGPGWDVTDDPSRSDGLVGGTFDDAGFPTSRRVLAKDGLWVGSLACPGTFRRSSFRDPPSEDATNLVMDGDGTDHDSGTADIAERCRVIRSSPELWVLELDIASRSDEAGIERIWVRTTPIELLWGCVARLGGPQLTPDGPIVPALLFEGIGQSLFG